MDKKHIIRFMVRETLQLKTDANRDFADRALYAAIKKAHGDTLTGRFHLKKYCNKKSENGNEVVNFLYTTIKGCTALLSSDMLIEEITSNFKDENEVEFGAVQKLVNMTLKYLIVVNRCYSDLGYETTIYNIDEKNCHCPLDSTILEHLKKDTGYESQLWTKIEKDEYCEVQETISKWLKENGYRHYGNIMYDFLKFC